MNSSSERKLDLAELPLAISLIWNSLVLYSFHTRTGARDLGQLIGCWLACLAIVVWLINLPTLGYVMIWLLGSSLLLVTISLCWCRYQYKKLFDDNPPLCDEPEQIEERQGRVTSIIMNYRAIYEMVKTRASKIRALRADLLAMTYGFDTPGQDTARKTATELAPNPGKILSAVMVAILIIGGVIIAGAAWFKW